VVEVNVDVDEQGAAFVREVNSGKRSVPTIIFPDGTVLVEPSTEQLSEKFSKS
jgi:mycoredoxin